MNRLSAQQQAVLLTLTRYPSLPTVALRDVTYEHRSPWGDSTITAVTGKAVGNVLTRLRKRGFVESFLNGLDERPEWRVTDAGLEAIGYTR